MRDVLLFCHGPGLAPHTGYALLSCRVMMFRNDGFRNGTQRKLTRESNFSTFNRLMTPRPWLQVNLQSMTIEAVLAVRQKQCVGMADNMLSELKKVHAKDDVLLKMEEQARGRAVMDCECTSSA